MLCITAGEMGVQLAGNFLMKCHVGKCRLTRKCGEKNCQLNNFSSWVRQCWLQEDGQWRLRG